MISPEQSGDIKKNYCGHKIELFLDNLGNQELDNLRDHKHESYTSIYKLGGCNDIKNLPKNVLLFLDGLSNANKFEDGVYLYRYLKSEPK